MRTQICSKCKQIKNFEKDFDKAPGYANGRYRQCKNCRKNHPSQTPEKTLQRVYKQRQRNRQFIWDYYASHPCVGCGESDPVVLELDHCRGEAKVASVSQLVHNTRSLKTIRREIEKCDVVCANCHRKRTASTQGWYTGLICDN